MLLNAMNLQHKGQEVAMQLLLEAFLLVHIFGTDPIYSAYVTDKMTKFLFSHKGEVSECGRFSLLF